MPRQQHPTFMRGVQMNKLTDDTIVVAVRQRKGGSTKSNTILALATILALWGYHILLLEFDDNPYLDRALRRGEGERLDANATTYRLFGQTGSILPYAYDLPFEDMFNRVPPLRKSLVTQVRKDYAWEAPGKFIFLPGTETLNDRETWLDSQPDPTFILRKQLATPELRNQFDFILLDTTPQMMRINRNAAIASDYIIVPVPLASATSSEDFNVTFEAIQEDFRSCNSRGLSGPQLLGVVYQKYQKVIRGKPSLASMLYYNYTQSHTIMVKGVAQQRPAEIPVAELGCIPLDKSELIIGSETARYPLPMYAPRSALTQAYMYMARNFLKAVGFEAPAMKLPGLQPEATQEEGDVTPIIDIAGASV